jgi:hypothetical protein
MSDTRSNRYERAQLDKEKSQEHAWDLYRKGLSNLAIEDAKRLEIVKARREVAQQERLAKKAQKSLSISSASSVAKRSQKQQHSFATKK